MATRRTRRLTRIEFRRNGRLEHFPGKWKHAISRR